MPQGDHDKAADMEDGYGSRAAKENETNKVEETTEDSCPMIEPRENLCIDEEDAKTLGSIQNAISQTIVAPDGGWGWVVVFGAWMISLIVDGLTYTFGVLLGKFEDAFHEPKRNIALASSLQVGVYLMIGPIVSALINRFGIQKVMIAGSVIAGFAFILSSVSPDVTMLIMTYGFMAGVGFGMMYLPAIVAVSTYFDKRRAMATGIAVCGSGIGTFILAPLTKILIYEYNWRWTLVILGALIFNGIVCGLVMRPLEFGQNGTPENKVDSDKNSLLSFMAKRKVSTVSSVIEEKPVETIPLITLTDESDVTVVITAPEVKPTKTKPTAPEVKPVRTKPVESKKTTNLFFSSTPNFASISTPKGNPNSRSISEIDTAGCETVMVRKRANTVDFSNKVSLIGPAEPSNVDVRKKRTKAPIGLAFIGISDVHLNKIRDDTTQRGLSRKDINICGAVPLQNKMSELPGDIERDLFIQSMRSIDNVAGLEAEEKRGIWSCLPTSARETMEEMLNLEILKNKHYWFVLLGNFACMIGFYVPFVYVPERAIQIGIPETDAAFLISIIGITNTVGRVATGVFINHLNIDSAIVTCFALIICGLTTIAFPLCESYALLVTMSAIFGLAVASYISLCSILLCDLLGVHNLTNAFGFVTLFRGVACIIGPPMAGAIIDGTGTFDPAFYVGGGMIIVGGILHLFLRLPCKTQRRTRL